MIGPRTTRNTRIGTIDDIEIDIFPGSRRCRRDRRRRCRAGGGDRARRGGPARPRARSPRQLGGRATAFIDRETGELVDNGQHVLFGCYRETFASCGGSAPSANVRVQPSLRGAVPRRGRPALGAGVSGPAVAAAPARGGVRVGRAWWRDRLQALRVGRAVAASAAQERPRPVTRGDGCRLARSATASSGRLREWLWEPLAVAALNQSPPRRPRRRSCACSPRCSGPEHRTRRWPCP